MRLWVHFKVVVELDDCTDDANEVFERGVTALRDGLGDISGHTIVGPDGPVERCGNGDKIVSNPRCDHEWGDNNGRAYCLYCGEDGDA